MRNSAFEGQAMEFLLCVTRHHDALNFCIQMIKDREKKWNASFRYVVVPKRSTKKIVDLEMVFSLELHVIYTIFMHKSWDFDSVFKPPTHTKHSCSTYFLMPLTPLIVSCHRCQWLCYVTGSLKLNHLKWAHSFMQFFSSFSLLSSICWRTFSQLKCGALRLDSNKHRRIKLDWIASCQNLLFSLFFSRAWKIIHLAKKKMFILKCKHLTSL